MLLRIPALILLVIIIVVAVVVFIAVFIWGGYQAIEEDKVVSETETERRNARKTDENKDADALEDSENGES